MKFYLLLATLFIFNQLSLFSGGLAIPNNQSLEFIRNSGQLNLSEMAANTRNISQIDYYARTKFGKIFIRKNGFTIQVESFFKQDVSHDEETTLATNVHLATSNATHFINVDFVDANSFAIVYSELENNGYLNFYNSKSTPVLGVKSFKRVIVKNLYPQIDLVFYESEAGELEYDFQVGTGANPNLIQMRFTDQDGLAIDSLGNLEITTRLNNLLKDKPIAYQSSTSNKVNVGFKLNGDILSFDLGQYDKSKPLIIDPVTRISSSYYGGSGEDVIYRMKLDSKGNQYYAGYTQSVNSIASQNGYQVSFAGSEDAFLAKFDSTGARVWATYFGGAGFDIAYDVALDNNENPIITGETNSDSLIATPNSHQVSFGGGMADGFIAKFNTTGGLEWATYLGGLAEDKLNGVSCDNFGNIYAVGFTKSDDAIFSGGYQQQRAGKNDAILIKFNPNGERTWGTYFGGTEDDFFNKVVVGGSDIYAVGSTQSNNLNINANSSYSANYDVLMTKFSSSGSIDFSRYFGGSEFDSGNSIAFDTTLKAAYAIGSTKSSLSTFNAVQTTLGGFYDAAYYGAYPNGTSSAISYFGGESNDFGNDLIASDNSIYLVGSTISQTGISINGFQNSSNGKQEGFFTKISNSNLLFSSYYGGNGNDDIRTIAVNNDKFYIAGFTESSSSISTIGSYQSGYAGNEDGFFASFFNTKFELNTSGNYCIGQSVPFFVSTNITFNPNTLYKIELSDANGTFGSNPILLATKTNISGTQTVLLSKDILGDSINGNRNIRIRSTSPEYISSTQYIGINNKLKLGKINTTECVNQEITFSTGLPNGNYVFVWDFGDSILKTTNFNIKRSFTTPGLKKLKLTRTITNACTEVDSITFVVNDSPVYEIITQENYCTMSSGTFQVIRKDTLPLASTIKNVSVQNGYNVTKIKEGLYSFETNEIVNNNKILEFIAEIESNCSSTYKAQKTLKTNDFTEIKGETNPLIGIKYVYKVLGNYDHRIVDWTTDTTRGRIISQNSSSCTIEFKKSGMLTLFCTEKYSQCPSKISIDLDVVAADKATFTPKLDTICNLNTYKFSTSSDSNIIIRWEFYNSKDTIRGDKNIFELTPDKLIGLFNLKLVKTNKLNMLSDSLIHTIFVKEVVKPSFTLKSSFCLGDNLFELFPPNENISIEIYQIYKTFSYPETFLYSNKFYYYYNPRYVLEFDSVARYPHSIKVTLKYDNGQCISTMDSIFDAPILYKPEIRFNDGILETNVASEYLWILNGSKTFTTQTIENPENGTYSLKVKYGDCYTYSSTYSLNRNSIENDKAANVNVIQNNETLELRFASNNTNQIIFSNLLGNVIFTSNENTPYVSIPIVGLPSGVYILQVKTNEDSFTRKIILER